MSNLIVKTKRYLNKEFNNFLYNQQKVAFDHLPKCAGTTLNNYLEQLIPKRYIYEIDGARPEESVEEFKKMSQKKRNKIKVVYGHLTYQVFDYLPSNFFCVTIFREPIERIISHYYYVKRYNEHYLHELVIANKIELEDYCSLNLSHELQNWYVKHYSRLEFNEIENKPEESIEIAYKNILNNFNLIGFQDELPVFMDKFIKLANLRCQYRNEYLNKTNTNVKPLEISEETKKKIAKHNSLDIILYNKILKLKTDGVVEL